MDNSLYVGLSSQIVLQQKLDIIANNIANADTTGFKVEALQTAEDPEAPAFTLGGPEPVKFVASNGILRDFGQGSLRRTDSPLDLAVDGEGFFRISTAAGERYTRDGRFRLDDAGRLSTTGGQAVLDDGGGEIVIDPQKGPVSIGPDGTISQGEGKDILRVGKIGVVTFSNLSGLEKAGDNLYRNASNLQPTPVASAVVRQGMLEASNVNPILEMTRMIEVSRAYEQMAKMLDTQSDLATQAVNTLGTVQ